MFSYIDSDMFPTELGCSLAVITKRSWNVPKKNWAISENNYIHSAIAIAIHLEVLEILHCWCSYVFYYNCSCYRSIQQSFFYVHQFFNCQMHSTVHRRLPFGCRVDKLEPVIFRKDKSECLQQPSQEDLGNSLQIKEMEIVHTILPVIVPW